MTTNKKAIRQMKSGKTAGPVVIPAEAFKTDIFTSEEMVYSIFVNKSGQMRRCRRIGMKDSLSSYISTCATFRGIILLSVPNYLMGFRWTG